MDLVENHMWASDFSLYSLISPKRSDIQPESLEMKEYSPTKINDIALSGTSELKVPKSRPSDRWSSYSMVELLICYTIIYFSYLECICDMIHNSFYDSIHGCVHRAIGLNLDAICWKDLEIVMSGVCANA